MILMTADYRPFVIYLLCDQFLRETIIFILLLL